MTLSQEQKDIIWLLVKMGIIATAVSIPIGLWAIPRWREQPIIPALILTGAGLVIKEVMIGHAEHTPPLEQELAGAPVRFNPGRYHLP